MNFGLMASAFQSLVLAGFLLEKAVYTYVVIFTTYTNIDYILYIQHMHKICIYNIPT